MLDALMVARVLVGLLAWAALWTLIDVVGLALRADPPVPLWRCVGEGIGGALFIGLFGSGFVVVLLALGSGVGLW